ncbi:MAG: TetR/AcrR family transcriptional regulator C-terminal domain-containing protein [Myxococcales bacterium]|nr:TetR/AcrR family transcriptional regulator C-terminal domain-containing protein [Myxococcales bacterium]
MLRSALGIADREGLGGLTIRALAGDLGVTPMAVYRHVRDKGEIVDALLDIVVGDSAPTAHRTRGWRRWIQETFARMRAALRDHPGVLPLLGTRASFGPSALRVMDEVLGRLQDAGFDGPSAVRAFHVLISYTIGFAAIEGAARGERTPAERADERAWSKRNRERFAVMEAADVPNVVALAPRIAGFPTDEAFLAGIETILRGLAGTR